MNLLTHPSITSTATLEVAATTVESALQAIESCQRELKGDVRRTPNKANQPANEDSQRRWTMMYDCRRAQALFGQEHLRVAYLILRRATDALEAEVAKAHVEATELQASHGRDHDGAYRAALNVSVCDALRIEASEPSPSSSRVLRSQSRPS